MGKYLDKRFWEIDFLRGVAIIGMILFHLFYDLNYFGAYTINAHMGLWLILARMTAATFLLLVGVSLALSHSRATQKKKGNLGKKYLTRGLKIFSWGLAITVFTWIFLSNDLIIFGVLHLIGVSIILSYPFIRYRYSNLAIGVIIIAIGLYLAEFTFDFYWLVWLGFAPQNFYMLDYFPILPWFGLVLLGIFLGNTLYRNYQRRFNLPDISGSLAGRIFCSMGKHSLIIYLIHQPVLIAILYFMGIADAGFLFL